jgi:glycosyltransferase involved in cell wall biosynthesis
MQSSAPVCCFTVFTPTYNRARTLNRVYRSLSGQTFTDFEWLVVDDGSTDDTGELIARYQAEDRFPIRYFRQEHGHKKVAFNRGVREARGELFLSLDSDDEAMPSALEILHRHWQAIPEQERPTFCGVTGLCVDVRGRVVGSRFPADVLDSDSLEIRYRYRVTGEKWGFLRTDVLRMYPFPEDVEGHVPEDVVWSAIATRYRTRFVNETLRVYHAEEDSITRGGRRRPDANADGHALWAREVLCREWRWLPFAPQWFLRMGANYTRFHLHMRRGRPGRRWPLKGLVPRGIMAASWPLGLGLYLLDRWRLPRGG